MGGGREGGKGGGKEGGGVRGRKRKGGGEDGKEGRQERGERAKGGEIIWSDEGEEGIKGRGSLMYLISPLHIYIGGRASEYLV